MKNRLITACLAIILGFLAALGPQYIFKLCESGTANVNMFMRCHWTGQAEIGVGLYIALLGILMALFKVPAARVALSISLSFAGVLVILFPYLLIGGCSMKTMPCHTKAFPALLVTGVFTISIFTINAVYLTIKERSRLRGKNTK
jgi:hypothetical protein